MCAPSTLFCLRTYVDTLSFTDCHFTASAFRPPPVRAVGSSRYPNPDARRRLSRARRRRSWSWTHRLDDPRATSRSRRVCTAASCAYRQSRPAGGARIPTCRRWRARLRGVSGIGSASPTSQAQRQSHRQSYAGDEGQVPQRALQQARSVVLNRGGGSNRVAAEILATLCCPRLGDLTDLDV